MLLITSTGCSNSNKQGVVTTCKNSSSKELADTLRSSWHTRVLNKRKFWIYGTSRFTIVTQGS